MKRRSLSDKTVFTRQLTSTVSVMLVMLILGLVGTIAIGTDRSSDILKSRTGFTIIMTDEADAQDISHVNHALTTSPAVRLFEYNSAESNMAAWNIENGEDVMDILGINPFPADFSVRVNPAWATPDSISALASRFTTMAGVDEVSLNTAMISNLNHHIATVTWILSGVALGLLLISFVLINNTVRLTVYSRRFLIHTMKLVGATGSFIRGPFVRTGILSGLLAGIVASAILAALIAFAHSRHPMVTACLPWFNLAWLFPAMIVAAMAVCGTASTLATNRYLRMDYDDLF